METPATTNVPPLPQLGNNAHVLPWTGTTPASSGDSSVTIIPIHSEKDIYNKTYEAKLPADAERSPLRSGELRISARGIEVEGIETRPYPLLKLIAGLGVVVYFVIRLAVTFLIAQFPWLAPSRYYIWGGFLLLISVAGFINERRRGPTHFLLAWEAIYGSQIDKNGETISLVYTRFEELKAGKPKNYYVPLSHLKPATMAGIAATIAYYAPHSVNVTAPRFHWDTGRKIAWAVAGLFVVGMIVAIFWAATAPP